MFVGRHDHALDDKGRVVLPAGYRSSFQDRGFVLMMDGCIGLFTPEGFQEFSTRLKAEYGESREVSGKVFRLFMSTTSEVKLDTAGRITLPRQLLDQLGFDRQVVVAGLLDRVEIWPADRYQETVETAGTADELAEAVRRLGL